MKDIEFKRMKSQRSKATVLPPKRERPKLPEIPKRKFAKKEQPTKSDTVSPIEQSMERLRPVPHEGCGGIITVENAWDPIALSFSLKRKCRKCKQVIETINPSSP